MPHPALLLALVSLGSPPAPAEPQLPPDTGPSFAVTLSASLPRGNTSGDTRSVSEEFSAAFSLGAEACWRPHHALELGLTADLGYVPLAPTACPPDGTCFGALARAGVLLRLRAAPHPRFDTWLAAGSGVVGAEARVLDMSQRLYGYEYVRLSVGVDFLWSERSTLGVFGSWSSDEFVRESVRASGHPTETATLGNRDRHGWTTFGIRGAFGPARPRSRR